MSKGGDKHKARLNELSSFGKDLARRSKSHCELCDNHGVKLVIHEVPPVANEPKLEHCILVCEICLEQIKFPKRLDINHWHCLHASIWTEVPAAQVMAVLIAKQIAPKAPFAEELLDQVYLEESIQTWVGDAEKSLAKK
jgi:protein PhnA